MEKQFTEVTTYIDKSKGTYTVEINVLHNYDVNEAYCFVTEANGTSRSVTNLMTNYKQ